MTMLIHDTKVHLFSTSLFNSWANSLQSAMALFVIVGGRRALPRLTLYHALAAIAFR